MIFVLMTKFSVWMLFCFVVASASPTSPGSLFEEYWQYVLRNDPEVATYAGDHRNDHLLTNYSIHNFINQEKVLDKYLEKGRQWLNHFETGSDADTNVRLFVINLQFKLKNLMARSYLFPVSMMFNPERSMLSLLKYMTSFKGPDTYSNIISRYRRMPIQIDQQIELMREGMRTNFTLHERSMLNPKADWNFRMEESPFYKPFTNISSSFSAETLSCRLIRFCRLSIRNNASDAISNHLVPALMKLENFTINEYRNLSRPEIGVSSMPNGRAFYQNELSFHLSDTTVTPEEVHQMGLREVDRIGQEMEEVIRSLGVNLTREEFSENLRNNESQFFKTEEEALQTYRHTLEVVIAPKIPLLFKNIPTKKLTVEKVPKELTSGPGAYYMRPSADNSTPGTFFLDTSSLKNIPKYDVMTLALHEGNPGHHLQVSYSMEQENLPQFRKYDMHSNAFIEGWGLYAEYLGYELGLYEDPFLRYGHLSYEIFRACRMVVDTGMHVFSWSRQRAIDYMLNNSASTRREIEREVDRYITWPGQACAYKYGEIKLKELRKKAENALGDRFDIKEFHDTVLRNYGPLEIVSEQVDRYIQETKCLSENNSDRILDCA